MIEQRTVNFDLRETIWSIHAVSDGISAITCLLAGDHDV